MVNLFTAPAPGTSPRNSNRSPGVTWALLTMRPTEPSGCVRVAHPGVGRIVNAATLLAIYPGPGERCTSTSFEGVWGARGCTCTLGRLTTKRHIGDGKPTFSFPIRFRRGRSPENHSWGGDFSQGIGGSGVGKHYPVTQGLIALWLAKLGSGNQMRLLQAINSSNAQHVLWVGRLDLEISRQRVIG